MICAPDPPFGCPKVSGEEITRQGVFGDAQYEHICNELHTGMCQCKCKARSS